MNVSIAKMFYMSLRFIEEQEAFFYKNDDGEPQLRDSYCYSEYTVENESFFEGVGWSVEGDFLTLEGLLDE